MTAHPEDHRAIPHLMFVDDYARANIGGGELHILRLARAARERGWRVGIACTAGGGFEQTARQEGFEVWPVRMGRGRPFSRRRLETLFAQAKPDIVHIHGFLAMLNAAPAARAADVRHVLATVHNMPSAPLALRPGALGTIEFRLRAHWFQRTAQLLDAYVCVVTAAADELAEIGTKREKLVTILNGIPDPSVTITGREPGASADDTVLVGSVGRLENLKAYDCYIEAAALAAPKDARLRFRLVGDGSLRPKLQRQLAATDLGDRFKMTGWANDALSEIAQVDIYLVSSVTDTTNLTVLEAIGLGKPVVATDVGGISDAVIDGVNGYLVPPRRPDLLAEKMLALAKDPDRRAAMGSESRKRYESTFTEQHMAEEHMSLYDKLLNEGTVR